MSKLLANNYRYRRSFSKIQTVLEVSNLIEIQKRSYDAFLQPETKPEDREDVGLQAVFKRVFPIEDFSGRASLQFVSYELEQPKYDVDECRERGMTFSAPIKVTVHLVVWDVDSESGTRTVSNIKEQPVYFGEIPLMTENGTFIINGTERVVVSQLHRSPGIFFDSSRSKTGGQKEIFSARIIPNQGSWIDFEFDTKDILYVRIDRRRKLPATVLLRALGYDTESLLNYFYESERIFRTSEGWFKETTSDLLFQQKATVDVIAPDGSVICKKDKKFLKNILRKMRKLEMLRDETRVVDGRERVVEVGIIPISEEEIIGKVSAFDIVDMETGRIFVECNEKLTDESVAKVLGAGIEEFHVLFIDGLLVGSFLRDTLLVDKIESMEEAIIEIYRRLRSGDPPTWDTAQQHFENLFFNSEKYDLSRVGRHKLNHKLGVDVPLEQTTLTRQDILNVVKYLIDLKNNKGQVDDIDHLGNRRVRAVGELLENQYRVGLDRMGKAIKERMSLSEVEALMPNELINSKPVSAVIKEFFGSSQLSQFMDQTNPLSEITHKRRLSALGPGGLTRERAGFDVRDVHPTHYGRICPIETPEGPNIGLIASLSTFARVNEFGFIETPYREVIDGKVLPEVKFMDAMDEDQEFDGKHHVIAPASAPTHADGAFVEDLVPARRGGDFILSDPKDVTLMDVASNQLVSVAASLVPFLENDDANRALMGSNMQRQAVPVIRTEAPLVGTGIERVVARDSGVTVTAKRSGIVETVDASRIVVKTEAADGDEIGADVDIYNLTKFMRSNQNTCINQKPVVRPGDVIHAGDVIADGPATDRGELALGQNVVVAFMPWGGYNFEDSILISERLVREDMYTTIHIEEFEVAARDTKLGKEEITRDIPNVGDEALKDLDDSGIVRIGAEVRPGDILVGKITPKGETQLSPEEKLLRAIFGEKAGDVRDTSLRVPPGVEGTVIGAQVFAREGVEKDARALEIELAGVRRIERDRDEKVRTIKDSALRQLARVLTGHEATVPVVDPSTRKEIIAAGEKYTFDRLKNLSIELYDRIGVEERSVEDEVWRITDQIRAKIDEIHERYAAKIERLKKGDDLPPGVIKLVKVYVAIKRKLSVGDKMAGRHGNKGVISKILPVEDMPFLEDGSPVDIVLNPLGVPSRMNVGQILETHLGWAAKGMGIVIGDLLDRQERKELREYLKRAFVDQPEVQAFADNASDEELDRYADKYRNGVTVATPVFSGAQEEEIRDALETAGFHRDGQSMVFDGRTGEAFHQRVTVGVMYMLKLHHLVDDKIHARSIGPYSLVTQQPLGGKAQFGGQRLGEMEVWAMEAYGAAYGLQEFLTVKSDDVAGRTRMYESIVKGENVLEAGLPESFNVLVKEMQALALDVELIEDKEVLRQ
ncbi:MAG: DNA-directed RNA polymerase subunit beta [Alphaproteobacteria bacterium]|nr:DNA-directed RNA polymerase subunit beta [Alphaproteobacteria bacterium]MCB9696114.1 DNA-directed RNA polymerase subunit beta [Alphaproteobacteria bacterium]